MNPSNSIPALDIYLLGSFRVAVDGEPIGNHAWKRRSAAKLIKLLALEPQHRLHREQIIDILWTGRFSESLSNDLNKAIHGARRVLEPSLTRAAGSRFIITEKQQVALSGGELFIDVTEFEELANRAIKHEDPETCERALRLYRGDLLAEDLYEDWIVSRREHLRLLYRKLVTKTAAIYASREEFARSIELLKDLSLSDPTDERVHQDLMRLYALTGSKYQALRQFEVCLKALREIGFPPDERTVEIKEQIQAGKLQPLKKVIEPIETASAGDIVTEGHPARPAHEPPGIKKLTYNHGVVLSARFMSGGRSIVYSAAWEEKNFEIYGSSRETLETVATGIREAGIFAVSPADEVAVSLNRRFVRGYKRSGTLAVSGSFGRDLKIILENVQWADWHPRSARDTNIPEAERLAVIRNVDGRSRLEFPVGRVILETGGWLSHPRFSPAGDKIAFLYHPTLDDDGGEIVVSDLEGRRKVLSREWISAQGLAWSAAGEELWFTAAREGNLRAIYAVDMNGGERLLYKATGSLTLHDVAADGAALVTLNKIQIKIAGKTAADPLEKDLTYHDWSLVRDISRDGQTILFTEAGESGGAQYAAYIRGMDQQNVRRLGAGSALAFSPDGRQALVKLAQTPPQLALYTVDGSERTILNPAKAGELFYQPWACYFPDGGKVLLAANEAESGTKLFLLEIGGGLRCLTPEREGFELSTPHAVSPDGKKAAVIGPDKRICFYDFAAGQATPLENLEPNLLPVGWNEDGTSLFFRERGKVPAVIYRCELPTGRREAVLELCPQYRAGVYEILRVLLTPDQKSYAYSYTREFSDLMLIEGLG